MPCSDPDPTESLLSLHRAAWILPISSVPIKDGIVAVRDGIILEAGAAKPMREKYLHHHQAGQARLVDHGDGVIMPSLVNAHTHLELSCLAGKIRPAAFGFVDWIRQLVRARAECTASEVAEGIRSAIGELWQRGVGLVGDISNTGASIDELRKSSLSARIFLEAIGFRPQRELENQAAIQAALALGPHSAAGVHLSLAAHAPYSVSARYLQLLRQSELWSDRPFSIHVAESCHELLFLASGEGELKSFLIERGVWDESWSPPRTTPVRYLSGQGILRPRTICVHANWVSDEDIELLAKTATWVCLCPRSNYNLGTGLSPVLKFLERGVPLCLGTDSLASNSSLCLWQEMAFLKAALPNLSSRKILRMATLSGALALGEKGLGKIEAGQEASLIFLPITARSGSELEDALVLEGGYREVKWVSQRIKS
ncbi:MAG: amidohydrolase family protein [bacterium]|nr:amidohydrolase family protein [bacterium]